MIAAVVSVAVTVLDPRAVVLGIETLYWPLPFPTGVAGIGAPPSTENVTVSPSTAALPASSTVAVAVVELLPPSATIEVGFNVTLIWVAGPAARTATASGPNPTATATATNTPATSHLETRLWREPQPSAVPEEC